jgi:hypothetical protein
MGLSDHPNEDKGTCNYPYIPDEVANRGQVPKHHKIIDICVARQYLQTILEVQKFGDKVLVLGPSIFGSKEDDLPW